MAEERRDGVFEVKFPVAPESLDRVLGWMRSHLEPDPHGTGEAGDIYDVQSLYLDTPAFDVYHRRGSYGRAKFRVRRYGAGPVVFLERKLKRDGVVRKRRVTVQPCEVERLSAANGAGGSNGDGWEAGWFKERLELRQLRPAVMMNYRRAARYGTDAAGRFRVTLDRTLRAIPASEFEVPRPIDSRDLFEGGGVLEVKFGLVMPGLMKAMVEELGLKLGGLSKFRLGIRSCGLVRDESPATESATTQAAGTGSVAIS